MDYAGLQTAIADFLNRSDLYATIPTFIALTEAQLQRRLTREGVQGTVNRATTTISAEYETTPADFGGPISLTVYDPATSKWKPLEPVTPTGMATIKADREATAKIPDRFSVVGSSFWFSPTPDATYTVDLQYWATIPPLTITNTTNWVLSQYPDVYLYGALTHAAPYLRDMADTEGPTPIQAWQDYYDKAVIEIVENERGKRGVMFTPSFRASDAPPNFGRRRWLWDITTGE